MKTAVNHTLISNGNAGGLMVSKALYLNLNVSFLNWISLLLKSQNCVADPLVLQKCSLYLMFKFLLDINVGGGQSGTYLRLTRASSGLQVSVAKTYRD